MKKILFDANFQNNKLNEQITISLFTACKTISSNFVFDGFGYYKTDEIYPDNVILYNTDFAGIGKVVRGIVPPIVTTLNKNIPFYFPCGHIPNFMPEHTPIISMISDVIDTNSKHFYIQNSIKDYKRKLQTDINRSDIVFVPSECIKKHLMKDFLFLNEPIVLNFASTIPAELSNIKAYDSNEKYFYIDVNNCIPEYLNELLKAFIYSHMTNKKSVKLYLIGDLKTATKELLINLQVARKVGAVVEYRSLTIEQKAAMLRGAIAAVLVSENNILPMTHLDAMACSCPIITNNTDEIKEICGGSVIYINPTGSVDIVTLAQELYKRDDIRAEYIAKGIERVKKYSWNNAANIFVENINKLYYE